MHIATITAAAIVIAGSALDAEAHDRWADGGPVPAWVKQQCCGVADVHHLRATQIHVTPSGYKVDGYRDIIPEKQLLPSPDGDWWVFYKDFPNGSQSPVYCFFGPPQGS